MIPHEILIEDYYSNSSSAIYWLTRVRTPCLDFILNEDKNEEQNWVMIFKKKMKEDVKSMHLIARLSYSVSCYHGFKGSQKRQQTKKNKIVKKKP